MVVGPLAADTDWASRFKWQMRDVVSINGCLRWLFGRGQWARGYGSSPALVQSDYVHAYDRLSQHCGLLQVDDQIRIHLEITSRVQVGGFSKGA